MGTQDDASILMGELSIQVNDAGAFASDPAVKLAINRCLSALMGAPSAFINGLAITIDAGRRLVSVFESLVAWRRLSSASGLVRVSYLVTLPGLGPDVGTILEALQTSSAGAVAALIDSEIGEAIGHDRYSVNVLSMDAMVLRYGQGAAEKGADGGNASAEAVLNVGIGLALGGSALLAAGAFRYLLRRRRILMMAASQEVDRSTSCHHDKDKGKLPMPIVVDVDDEDLDDDFNPDEDLDDVIAASRHDDNVKLPMPIVEVEIPDEDVDDGFLSSPREMQCETVANPLRPAASPRVPMVHIGQLYEMHIDNALIPEEELQAEWTI
jgi:hypothetical protein